MVIHHKSVYFSELVLVFNEPKLPFLFGSMSSIEPGHIQLTTLQLGGSIQVKCALFTHTVRIFGGEL